MMLNRRRTGGSQAERAAAARFGNRPNAWPSCARGLASRCGRRCPSPAPAMSHAPQPMPGRQTILFDAKTPKALPGGMGLAFDWSLLAGYRGALPWGLAGGAKSDECCRGDCAHRSAAGRYLQRRRKRAGRQGYRQDYQFRLCVRLAKSRRSIGVVQRKNRLAGAPLPSE